VAGDWEFHRDAVLLYNPTIPGVRNAIRTTLGRLWLGPLVSIDPDASFFCSEYNGLTDEQKRQL
jgi:alpha-galactosidase